MQQEQITIMVVDDEPLFRKLLVQTLEKEGWKVIEAGNGVSGWELFQQQRPDLALVDLQMPQMDGLTLLGHIRELSPTTPVIIMSGTGTMEEVIEALRLGAHDYLNKPFLDKTLPLHAVRKAVDHLRMARFAASYQNELRREVEQKTAALEQELARRIDAENEMRTAKDEWELTFNAVPDLVAIIDRDHRLLRINRAMAEFIGQTPAEAVGQKCCEVMHRLHHAPDFCPHTLLLRDGSSHQIEAFDEVMGGHFEISVIPFYSQDGTTLLGSIHVAKNIDERKMKEDEQNKLQAQLLQAQKLESIGQLAAGIAHEINTPIQFISANNDFLIDSFHGITQLVTVFLRLYQAAGEQTVDSALLKEVAHTVKEIDWEYLAEEIPLTLEQNKYGFQRVASIVMAMKEFSHPGPKEKELRNINKLLDITITVARNEWKYVAEVITDLDPNLPEMVCNADELNQVFLNIIVNAAHAIEDKIGKTPDSEKGVIRITSHQPEAGLLEIRISDTGGGIPEQILEKVFDPFFTTKKQGRGTGQGLAIARTIVENRHGGRIHIETELGVGTTFVLRFPTKTARVH